jgi:glycosyltransferase involved in cell wall biosynthesis
LTTTVRTILVAVLLGTAVIGGLMIWNGYETQQLIKAARQSGNAIGNADIDHAKAREEYVGKRYENDSRGIIVNFLLTNFGSAIALIGALGGGLIALYGYIDARRKEALDRSASDLKDTLSHLASKEPQERVVGIVGLQHFFVADRSEFHRAAVTALVAAARMETHPEVLHSIRIAIEQAMKAVHKDVLTQVSWQNVKANGVDLSGVQVEGIDLRDAELRDSRLDKASLSGAKLNAAKLLGAKLAGAHLDNADLTYADMAGASLVDADLRGAKFSRASVQNLDLRNAQLGGLDVDWDTIPWDQTLNWRSAHFDTDLWEKLLERFGRAPNGPRILMLMWEIPPFVAGGTWTACYHFVRKLVRAGADLTIVVPWNEASIVTSPFGNEVKIVPMGIRLPQQFLSPTWSGYTNPYGSPYGASARSPYGAPAWSPYGVPAWSPYSAPAWSPYSAPAWSPYGAAAWSPYFRSPTGSPYGQSFGPYSNYGQAQTGRGARSSMEGSILLRLIDEFRDRFVRYVESQSPDLIHAHDWVTFEAASKGARQVGAGRRRVPWIAHVHSIEMERRPEGPDRLVERMEQEALATAAAVVTPSRITQNHVCNRYGLRPDTVHVVPNVLSYEPADGHQTGLFESGRVVFLGRTSHQKGLDRFLDLARATGQRRSDAQFHVYGSGHVPTAGGSVSFHGPLSWERRGDAFRDATILVVPSRAEPFGMVILEGMLHRVPVIYPQDSGAAEVLNCGIKFEQNHFMAAADEAEKLLGDLLYWENVVERQLEEIARYCDRGFERSLIDLWQTATNQSARSQKP